MFIQSSPSWSRNASHLTAVLSWRALLLATLLAEIGALITTALSIYFCCSAAPPHRLQTVKGVLSRPIQLHLLVGTEGRVVHLDVGADDNVGTALLKADLPPLLLNRWHSHSCHLYYGSKILAMTATFGDYNLQGAVTLRLRPVVEGLLGGGRDRRGREAFALPSARQGAIVVGHVTFDSSRNEASMREIHQCDTQLRILFMLGLVKRSSTGVPSPLPL